MTIELKLSFVQNPSCLPLSLVVSLDFRRFSQEELRPKFEAVAGAKKRLSILKGGRTRNAGSDGDKFMSWDASTNSIVGHNCWMDICFILLLVSLEFPFIELERVHQIDPVGSSIVLHTVPIFFSQQKVLTTYQKTYQKFLEWFGAFFEKVWSICFFLAVRKRGLWEQRQGFLTAAAKREQQHLAEAEAEVLRHVAKLVPEAEAPKNSSGKDRDDVGDRWDHWNGSNSFDDFFVRRILLEEILEVLESQVNKNCFGVCGDLQQSIRVFGQCFFLGGGCFFATFENISIDLNHLNPS